MGVLLLCILFVVLIPIAEGGLLALVLREIHLRNPESIGQIIEEVNSLESDIDEVTTEQSEQEQENSEGQHESQTSHFLDDDDPNHILTEVAASIDGIGSQLGFDVKNAEETQTPTETVSVFDNASETPTDLPVTDEIHSMLTAASSNTPNDLENLVEQNDASEFEKFQELKNKAIEEEHQVEDEPADDIKQLRSEMPAAKIDFAAEFEQGGDSDDSYSVVQDVLGQDFDVDTWLQENPAEIAAEVAEKIVLDVREPERGLVQVSSLPLDADQTLIASEMILPDYSGNWIQELNSRTDSSESEADAAQFCFTEESRPMFTKKHRRTE